MLYVPIFEIHTQAIILKKIASVRPIKLKGKTTPPKIYWVNERIICVYFIIRNIHD